MERIEFSYVFRDGDEDEKMVTTAKRDENGLCATDVCEMFLDFMKSVGFSEKNVFDFFKE
jgi:hypothetical protein